MAAVNAPISGQPIKLPVDMSPKGLGTALIQDEHPISKASSALSTTQQHYAQVKKRC